MRTAAFLVFTFIKKGLKTTKVKSTACASKKIKTNHHRAYCETSVGVVSGLQVSGLYR